MTLIEKKRSGYPRTKARLVLSEYFKHNSPVIIPIPILKVAEFYGFEVDELDNLDSNQKAIKIELPDENRKLIGINSRFHVHNKRFSVGHELGHHFLNHPLEHDCSEEEIKICNQEADEFSAELLMPLEELKKQLKNLKDSKKIAKLFEVSEEALWIKIQHQKLLNLLS